MSVPSVFGLPHLSEDAVAAFADGVLTSSATERARRHCASCSECAEAVRIQREAAMMLRSACAPSLPSGLLARLAGLPMSVPLPPPSSGLPTVMGADGIPMFVSHTSRRPDHDHDGESDSPAEFTGHDPENAHPSGPRFGHALRVALPIGLLASAAAVVTVGTLGAASGSLNQTGQNQTATVIGAVQGRQAASPSRSNGSAARFGTAGQRFANAQFVPGGPLSVPMLAGAQSTPRSGQASSTP